MKILLFLALLLGFVPAMAQKEKAVIPFSTLQQWARSGYLTFHTQAKAIGFEFAGKEPMDACTDCMSYSYTRQIRKNGFIYTESLAYFTFGAGKKPKVEYTSILYDLGTIYDGSITKAGYAASDCTTNKDTENDAKTVFCFKKGIQNIRLIETRKKVDTGDNATEYCIMLYTLD